MITEKELLQIYNKLIADENFCRLAYYGTNPFDGNKEDIVSSTNYKELMKDIVRFAPETDDLETNERTRICMYKHHTRLKIETSAIRLEAVQFEIYVPHRLIREDMRVYQLENKIANILDGMQLGIGYMDYVDGHFVQLPNITGYVMYVMSFAVTEGRQVRYGKL